MATTDKDEVIKATAKMTLMEDSPRTKVLSVAANAILQDRNKQYGPPENNFQNIVDLWNTRIAIRLRELKLGYIDEGGSTIEANAIPILKSQDVAVWMMDVKTARLETSPTNVDNWADTAGYAGCGYECALSNKNKGVNVEVKESIQNIHVPVRHRVCSFCGQVEGATINHYCTKHHAGLHNFV